MALNSPIPPAYGGFREAIEEQHQTFRKYVEMGYLRDTNDPLGDDLLARGA